MFIRIVSFNQQPRIAGLMAGMGVDPYGIRIMLPKAQQFVAAIRAIPVLAATILKQESLSIGAELAVPRDCLTRRSGTTDCLLIITASQLNALALKLRRQPFGLKQLCPLIESGLAGLRRKTFVLKAGRRTLRLSGRTAVMAVMNITDDSFSGDGLLRESADPAVLARKARELVADGADLIDIGAESSRPGSRTLPAREELRRILPALKAVAAAVKVPISVDTCKADVAQACLENGASIINDITGMADPRMRRICARRQAAVVIMHMQGTPRTMQKQPHYRDLMAHMHAFFIERIRLCREAGITAERIILDPGIGFGKTLEHNLEILNRLAEFRQYGLPLCVGTSRKSFIGTLSKVAQPAQRQHGTTASICAASQRGAAIVRVHEPAHARQALAVFEAIENTSWSR